MVGNKISLSRDYCRNHDRCHENLLSQGWNTFRLPRTDKGTLRQNASFSFPHVGYLNLETCLDEAVYAAAFSASIDDSVGKLALPDSALNKP